MQTLLVNFQTCDDPVLEKMWAAANKYATDIRAGRTGWLSFLGSSGTGKTYLGKAVTRHLHGEIKRWPGFMAKMRTRDFNPYESVSDLAAHDVLMLDEIGVGNDAKTFGLDLLIQVMEARRTKPTIVTSNLTLQGLGDIDLRLASRLVRHGPAIACDTTDFALREHRS